MPIFEMLKNCLVIFGLLCTVLCIEYNNYDTFTFKVNAEINPLEPYIKDEGTYAVSDICDGLVVDSKSGVISGIPKQTCSLQSKITFSPTTGSMKSISLYINVVDQPKYVVCTFTELYITDPIIRSFTCRTDQLVDYYNITASDESVITSSLVEITTQGYLNFNKFIAANDVKYIIFIYFFQL